MPKMGRWLSLNVLGLLSGQCEGDEMIDVGKIHVAIGDEWWI